ncbi:ammonium transporter [Methylomicrobium album]|uniref:Ammonium transporter n=1 Tax=Methylomicrobium album BG8 TaxID=686340 RepID=H8GM69_METAL|nr:ammonium transporter [Methylomicrobium album]EIC29430.1 ammonium transporter [Methylomicrobium album BG8]
MRKIPLLSPLAATPFPVFAEDGLNSADTAWILTSAGLVLFMTMPGLALFYGGLVRTRNVLSVIMACFSITSLISLIWAIAGYSLALTDGGAYQAVLGGFSQLYLIGMNADRLVGNLPESVFAMYHMTFAIFAPALIVGAMVERVRFFPLLFFCAFWELLVYVPVCHWIWGNGWLAEWGVMDFAGGIVVHGSAGVAALAGALAVGPRRGFPRTPMMPHNLTMTAMGAGILWVGWHGFSAGSALMANGSAGMAMLSTHLCASSASITWIVMDWLKFGKPSVLGAMTGMVAGLGMIAAGAGFVSPFGAILIGIVAGIACFYSIQLIKQRLGIDDALDVFPVHGISGILGALLTAVFADTAFGGTGIVAEGGIFKQILIQLFGIGVTIAWSGLVSFLLFKAIDKAIGVRVTQEAESIGLDIDQHDQQGYSF